METVEKWPRLVQVTGQNRALGLSQLKQLEVFVGRFNSPCLQGDAAFHIRFVDAANLAPIDVPLKRAIGTVDDGKGVPAIKRNRFFFGSPYSPFFPGAFILPPVSSGMKGTGYPRNGDTGKTHLSRFVRVSGHGHHVNLNDKASFNFFL